MDSLEKLKHAIIEQVKAHVPVQVVWAKCVRANAEKGTMVAEREGLEYHDVLLGLGSDITVPQPNSLVLLGIIENRNTATWLVFAERVQERRLNGNVRGGLVVASTVRQVDTTLINKVNALVAALNAWTPTVPTPTLADLATLKAAFTTWAVPIPPVPPSTYENPIVKHG